MKATELLSENTIDGWIAEINDGTTDSWVFYNPIGGYEFKRKDSDLFLFHDSIYQSLTIGNRNDTIKYGKFPFRLRRKLNKVKTALLKSMAKRIDADKMIRANDYLQKFGMERQPSLSEARSLLKSTIISMLDDMLQNVETLQEKWVYVDDTILNRLFFSSSYLIVQNWPGGQLTIQRTKYRDSEVRYALRLSYPYHDVLDIFAAESWQRATINHKLNKLFQKLNMDTITKMSSLWGAWDYLLTQETNDNYCPYVIPEWVKAVEAKMIDMEANGPDEHGQMKLNFDKAEEE